MSKINEIREIFKANQVYIQHEIGIDELEYYYMVFNTGMAFLDDLYPSPKYACYHAEIRRREGFWLWWNSIYKQREAKLVEKTSIQTHKLSKLRWKLFMTQLPRKNYVSESYHLNYLKYQKTLA